MLTTIDQFSNLSLQTHIDGLEPIVKNFDNVVDDIRRKPYDLLDFANTQFDRDYMEFNVNIHELEMAIQASALSVWWRGSMALLQGFVDACFEEITTTDHALNLLRQFQSILTRDSFQESLNAKYLVIFQNYGNDVEFVQRLYESKKNSAPLPHNAPLVSGPTHSYNVSLKWNPLRKHHVGTSVAL